MDLYGRLRFGKTIFRRGTTRIWLHAYIRSQIADRMSAGPDGIRQERPHLLPRAFSTVHISGSRSCGPTCRAITHLSSCATLCSQVLAIPLKNRSRAMRRQPHSSGRICSRAPGLPTPYAPSCWPMRPQPRLAAVAVRAIRPRHLSLWRSIRPLVRHESAMCANRGRHAC